MPDERIAVVGAGLSGCLLATLLARRGLAVTVYERRARPAARPAPSAGARSTWRSRRAGSPRWNRSGCASSRSAGRCRCTDGWCTRSTARRASGPTAPTAGGRSTRSAGPNSTTRCSTLPRRRPASRCASSTGWTDSTSTRAVWSSRRRTGLVEQHADVVLASDGAYSAARQAITFRHGFTFSQDYLEHGYKELTIPARDGEFATRPGRAAHLAARLVDDDRPAEPGPVLHLHAVLAEGRTRGPRHGRPRCSTTSGPITRMSSI